MAEYGEWTQKGATLSDVTAKAEYGVDREFVINGIKADKLEYRQGSMWGNPCLRILRSQLVAYIVAELGQDYLVRHKSEFELSTIKKQISVTKKTLKALEHRKNQLEAIMS